MSKGVNVACTEISLLLSTSLWKSVTFFLMMGCFCIHFPTPSGKLWKLQAVPVVNRITMTEMWVSVVYGRDGAADLYPRRIKQIFHVGFTDICWQAEEWSGILGSSQDYLKIGCFGGHSPFQHLILVFVSPNLLFSNPTASGLIFPGCSSSWTQLNKGRALPKPI